MGKLIAVSLFSGSGAMDLGIEGGFDYLGRHYTRHPVEIAYAIDNDKYACDIYNANFRIPCTLADIRTLESEKIPPHHILLGGFPCQSFSIVAQNPPRLGYDDKSSGQLVLDMCRIAAARKPMCIIAENVKGLLNANRGKAFPVVLKAFEEAGYFVKHQVLDASDYGVPQKRERVFIVGFKDHKLLENFKFPKPVSKIKRVVLSAVVDPDAEVEEKYWFSEKAVQGMLRVRDKMNKGRVQNLNEPCNTVSAHLAKISLNSVDPVLKVDGHYRRFTPREVARIQAFPDSFVLIGSDTRQYRAIGNAVPPVLMWYVTREIIKAIKKTDVKLFNTKPFRTSQEIRSYNMSQIKSKDTTLEMILRKALWQKGFRFHVHVKELCGKPDIVFQKQKVTIFCDSAFWHGRDVDRTIDRIKTNKEYWLTKIRRNIERDLEVTDLLGVDGWRVIRVWDYDIKHNLESVISRIERELANVKKSPDEIIRLQSGTDQRTGISEPRL